MPSNNLVISRLQNQRSRIQGMLSPGKKPRQSGDSMLPSLSPVAKDFAGKKFLLAARKMRSLDPGNIKQTLSGGLTSLSVDIHNKFTDIHKILHIDPSTSREDSIWSSVETPLPESQPSRQASPDEPDVMRSGSVIQKMSMLPKPGQSLDSFKDQVQKKPRSKTTSPAKKPVIGQNTRRFSQIQEVTPGQKLPLPELPAVPVEPDETQIPLIKTRETPDTATFQSQPDPSASATDKTTIIPKTDTVSPQSPVSPVKKGSAHEMPLSGKPRKSEPAIRSEKPARDSDEHLVQPAEKPQVDTSGSKEVAEQQPPQIKPPAREIETLKALPVAKKPPIRDVIKKALPVKKDQETPQKPVARPTIQPRTEIAPQATIRPVIQRQAEEVRPSAAPARLDIQELPQKTTPRVKTPPPPVDSQAKKGSPEMPLRQNIDYRQKASRAVRAIVPDQMKPLSRPPLIHGEDTPLLNWSLISHASTQASLPEKPAIKGFSPLPKPDQPLPPLMHPESLPMDVPPSRTPRVPAPENLSPIPMPLVAQFSPPAPALAVSKAEPATEPVKSTLERPIRKTSAVPKTNNTIQRSWEGHTPPGSSSSEKSGGENGRAESINLEILAEDVFPYVKRILEIETERSSGKLR